MSDKVADINQFARYTFNRNKHHIKSKVIGTDNREYALCVSKNSNSMYFLPNTYKVKIMAFGAFLSMVLY